MRPKSLILLLLALGCGLVASIGISQVMANRNQGPAPVVETDKILVANKDIKVNEMLSDKNIQVEDWPKEKIPVDAVRDIKELDGQAPAATFWLANRFAKPSSRWISASRKFLMATASLPYKPMR